MFWPQGGIPRVAPPPPLGDAPGLQKLRIFAALCRVMPIVSHLNSVGSILGWKLAIRRSRVRSPPAPPIESRGYGRIRPFLTSVFLQHLPNICRCRVQNSGRDSPRPRHPVRINPQPDRRVRVPELRRDVCEIRAGGEHVGRPRVPQIMRRPPPDLRGVLNLVPDPPQEIAVVDRGPVLRREDPSLRVESRFSGQRLFLPFHPEPLEFRSQFRAHVDLALRRLCLRGLHLAVMRNVPPHDDIVLREVDIMPLQGPSPRRSSTAILHAKWIPAHCTRSPPDPGRTPEMVPEFRPGYSFRTLELVEKLAALVPPLRSTWSIALWLRPPHLC